MWPTIDFELGVWNAWIFMLLSLLTWPLFFRLAKVRAPHPSRIGLSKPKMIFCIFSKLIFLPAVAYSFFLPLKFGTIWFYVGLPITLVGLVASVTVLVNWASTTPGKPVTRGLYRYSRHPMYVANSLFLLGVSIASASWVFLLYSVINMVFFHSQALAEEQVCLKTYGKEYRQYKQNTPRWLGLPKLK